MSKVLSAVCAFALLIALALGSGRAEDSGQTFVEQAFARLVGAMEARSLEQFTALGDEGFRAMPQAEFDRIAGKFGPLFGSGYKATYLGEFTQQDTIVHYWKLSFTAESDDWLAKIGVREGKLRGFIIQRP